MQFLRRLFSRLFSSRSDRRRKRSTVTSLLVANPPAQPLTIHRDVSRNGVRVVCLCGSCGARLERSATLCEDCARARSRSTPGF